MENNQPVNDVAFRDDEQSSFNLLEWVWLFVKYWYLFVFGVTIAMSIAYYENRSWMANYRSEAQILLQETQSSFAFIQGTNIGRSNNYSQNSENQKIFLKSYDLVGRTIDSLPDFRIHYYTQGRFKTRSRYKEAPINIEIITLTENVYNQSFIFSEKGDSIFEISVINGKDILPEKINGKYGEPIGYKTFFIKIFKDPAFNGKIKEVRFRFRSREFLIADFVSRLSINTIEKTSIIALSLTGNDTKYDIDFLNKHSKIFLEDNLDKKNIEAIKTINFINDQIEYMADSLSRSEANFRSFKISNNIIDYASYSGDLPKKMADIEQKGKELMARDNYFSYLKNYLTKNIETGAIVSPTTIGITDPALLNLVSQYNKLQIERSEVQPKHPKYEEITKQMEQQKQYLLELINSVNSVYNIERATYNKEVAEVNKLFRDAPEKERRLLDYERKFKINDSYYTFLLQKRSEAQMKKAANTSDNQIIQQARVITITNGKDKRNNIYIFLALGLLIPAIFIIIKELLNFTIKTERDIEKLSPFPLISSIKHTRHKNDEIVMASKYPNSAFVEALRVIRTKIEIILQRREKFIVMISSAESGDGKTYVSANLAGTFALQKKRTLLIDFDLRKPNLSHLINIEHHKKIGFVNYLIGDVTLDDIIETKEEYGFDFMTSGIMPPNPGEFVRDAKFKEFFDKLRTMYDYIIIDTSPLGLVADAYALLPLVDITLLTARSLKTNKVEFRELTKQLKSDGMKNIFIVLNDVDKKKIGYQNYGYGYGYGYGYTSRRGNNNYYVTEEFEKDEQSVYKQFLEKIKSIFKK